MLTGLLLLVGFILAIVLYFAVPRRGITTGRTSFLPGTNFAFQSTSRLPVLSLLHRTTVLWRGHRFEFALVRFADRVCRAYILEQPGYLRQATGLGATHRLTDTLGREYVCWTPEPRDADQMAAAVALWVVGTCRYRESGHFPDPLQAAHELRRS
ncbi:hypothetical protein ABIE00_005145 [Arthrobacter sp. OAP107]